MGLVTSASFPSVCCRSLEVHRRVAKAITEGKKSSHAAVRHDKSSLLSVLQGKTQSHVKGQVNSTRSHFPGVEASGDRSHTVQQSDDVSQENRGEVSGEGPISLVSQEFSGHGTRGIRFGRLVSDSLEHQVGCDTVQVGQNVFGDLAIDRHTSSLQHDNHDTSRSLYLEHKDSIQHVGRHNDCKLVTCSFNHSG